MTESNELTVQNSKEVITQELVVEYLKSFGIFSQLDEADVGKFVAIAKSFNLNPFKREIYCVPYKNKVTGKKDLSIITGYEVYLKRAERSGKLSGWNCISVGSGKDLKAVITISRKDWTEPLVHEVYHSEYAQDNKMWKGKPQTMIKKVAMAQGFRLAFPEDVGGMPYTADELPDIMTKPTTEPPQKKAPKEVDVTVEDVCVEEGVTTDEPLICSVAVEFKDEEGRAMLKNAKFRWNKEMKTWCKEMTQQEYDAILGIFPQAVII